MFLVRWIKSEAQRQLFSRSTVSLVALVSMIGVLDLTRLANAALDKTVVAEEVKQCDRLASQPNDPQRHAAPVADEQFAPGEAIEVCESAHRDAPGLPRVTFELGRAYWLGQQYSKAFGSFSDAAQYGYAPAKKYIGDLYLLGRGLPIGQHQNLDEALRWYRASALDGFSEAEIAMERLEKRIARKETERFDPTAFQNEKFIKEIYDGTFEDFGKNEFMFYINSFVSDLGGDQVLFVNAGCKPEVNARLSRYLITWLNNFRSGDAYKYAYQLGEDIFDGMITNDNPYKAGNMNNYSTARKLLDLHVFEEQGDRDAVALVNRYTCNSDVARRILKNLLDAFARS